MGKKKPQGDRVLIQFSNNEQARAFFDWFNQWGLDALLESDSIRDDLPGEFLYQCISASEYPGSTSDPECYYIEIE